MKEGQINQAGEGDRVLAESPVRNGKGQAVTGRWSMAGGKGMKEASDRKARYGGHTCDHQIYRMLSLCPPLIRGDNPAMGPFVTLLRPWAAVALFLALAHHCLLFWWCVAVTARILLHGKNAKAYGPNGVPCPCGAPSVHAGYIHQAHTMHQPRPRRPP